MDALQSTFSSMMEQLNAKMAVFQSDLQKINTTPSTVTTLAADFAVFQSFVSSTFCNLQQQLELLNRQMDQFEMRSRKKILLFHGVQESSESNASQDTVKVVAEKLNIHNFSEVNISRCNRLGRSSGDKPRPIVVKFTDLALRNKIWFAKTALKGTGITFSEFLTKGRHDAFMNARRHFGIKKCWTRDGSVIIVGSDGAKHQVTTAAEVNNIINSQSDNVSAVSQPAVSVAQEAGSTAAPKVPAGVAARAKRFVRK
ncbi:uncharacterized protein LOC131853122 [Achroia grisella]|uniref:uncharacterized protein LOC131841352 n=1 Tax=Achroia grisella TaxID=688607 RepID=UPI0027D2F634|nr:uncharacterized protein LOC131841352 [Achroia grisella]XP_059059951.1 uncharacterized protein LOC131853122 [Achroia grisella]